MVRAFLACLGVGGLEVSMIPRQQRAPEVRGSLWTMEKVVWSLCENLKIW